MWNRQREAQEAREKLALVGDDASSTPSREPPDIEDPLPDREPAAKVEPATAAE
jgi:ATP-binding cassette subfamily B protein